MTVFFDIDTQVDFLDPHGALYVPGAETIVDRVAALNHYAESQGIPLVSTMDAHSENDPEFRNWPRHCVVGTPGQKKPPATVLKDAVVVPNNPGLPDTSRTHQILLEKQALDCFTNVNLPALLERLGVASPATARCVVYGVVTEICVKYAAFGLLRTGRQVEIVTDAVKELDSNAASAMLAEFTAAGGTLTTADRVMTGV